MRDAQSLLEQMLSYGGSDLTAESVHRALRTAPDDGPLDLTHAPAGREPARGHGPVGTQGGRGLPTAAPSARAATK